LGKDECFGVNGVFICGPEGEEAVRKAGGGREVTGRDGLREAIIENGEVVGIDEFDAGAERVGIAPRGEESGRDGNQTGKRDEKNAAGKKTRTPGGEEGNEGDESEGEAQSRKIRVAVGDGDHSNQDDARNGEKEADEGGQSHGESGTAAEKDDGLGGERKENPCGNSLKGRMEGESQAHGGQGGGPNRLGEVKQVAGREPADTVKERGLGNSVGVKMAGQGGEHNGQEEERPFFEDEAEDDARGIPEGKTPEGPAVEKKEEEREGDEHGFGEESEEEEEKREDCSRAAIADIGFRASGFGRGGEIRPPTPGRQEGFEIAVDGGEGKEGGEGVLAFGDPGDGFDTQGVERPKGGGEEGEPRAADGGTQDEPKQGGVCGVEQDVGKMVAPRGEGGSSEEKGVEEEGNPKERAVHHLVAVEGGEGAAQGGPGEAVGDDGIVADEEGVVKIDQTVPDGGGKKGERRNEEEKGREEGDERGGAGKTHGSQWKEKSTAVARSSDGWHSPSLGRIGAERALVRFRVPAETLLICGANMKS
jgi:hypothetical protein